MGDGIAPRDLSRVFIKKSPAKGLKNHQRCFGVAYILLGCFKTKAPKCGALSQLIKKQSVLISVCGYSTNRQISLQRLALLWQLRLPLKR
jgi:hypothetical protein